MAYNQMLQNTIEGVKAIARTDLCVLDTDANIIASTMNIPGQNTENPRWLLQNLRQRFRLLQVISISRFLTVDNWNILCLFVGIQMIFIRL